MTITDLLIDEIELSVGIKPINTSHIVGLNWWALNSQGHPYDHGALMFSLFLDDVPYTHNHDDVEALSDWVNGYAKNESGGSGVRVFDIIEDYSKLWILLKKEFPHMDIEGEPMHWHKFLSMFDIAVSGCGLDKIIEYRSYKPSKSDSKEYKEHMLSMQKKHGFDTYIEPSQAHKMTEAILEQKKRAKKDV